MLKEYPEHKKAPILVLNKDSFGIEMVCDQVNKKRLPHLQVRKVAA